MLWRAQVEHCCLRHRQRPAGTKPSTKFLNDQFFRGKQTSCEIVCLTFDLGTTFAANLKNRPVAVYDCFTNPRMQHGMPDFVSGREAPFLFRKLTGDSDDFSAEVDSPGGL